MRIGIYLPYVDRDGKLVDGPGIAERARMIEAAGFESIWLGDHTPIPGDTDRDVPDPFLYLSLCAMATSDAVELGTCVYCLPLRNKYENAQRLFTLETIAKGRFTIGIGTGSQEVEYEANGLDWSTRFARMADHMEGIREVFAGKPTGPLYRQARVIDERTGEPGRIVIDPAEDLGPPWGVQVGPPRFGLGAWKSPRAIARAATDFDCWIPSASPAPNYPGWRKVFTDSIETYRAAGGRRAIMSTVLVNLREDSGPLRDDEPFSLRCPPAEAKARLEAVAELGYDDIILNFADPRLAESRTGHAKRYDPTAEDFAQLRALIPRDGRDYHLA